MPHYDESFIHDDNQNQRRNKRSYRVYKNGLNPLHLLERSAHALEEKSSNVIKRNIKNIKHRGNRYRPELEAQQPFKPAKYKTPDIIVSHRPRISVFEPNKYYDLRNNNILPLTPCKSFDNLTLKPAKRNNSTGDRIRNGASLQNLTCEENLKLYVSPSEDRLSATYRDDAKNSYSVADARRRPMQRCFSRYTAAPGIGVYRQIPCEGVPGKSINENDSCGESGSGHRGSLRGANKLARRARSFKDDLLERISNMRSPAQQHHPPHLSSAIRSAT